MKHVVVYFDYISPYAYFAAERLPELAMRSNLELEWKPIELLKLSNYSEGLPYTEVKRRYVMTNAIRAAEFYGVSIAAPKPHPVESIPALHLALAALADPKFQELHSALFRAAWAEQRDVSSSQVLADCVEQVGGSPEWLAKSGQPGIARVLAENTAEAEAAGVFGAPSMVFEGELFWGLDSFAMLEWRLAHPRRHS